MAEVSFFTATVLLPSATDKVALLIGNLTYRNHPQLKAPMVDVYDLTNLLRQLNFKVVSLLDLTESEMRNAVEEFLSLLHKGVYGTVVSYNHCNCLIRVNRVNFWKVHKCLSHLAKCKTTTNYTFKNKGGFHSDAIK